MSNGPNCCLQSIDPARCTEPWFMRLMLPMPDRATDPGHIH